MPSVSHEDVARSQISVDELLGGEKLHPTGDLSGEGDEIDELKEVGIGRRRDRVGRRKWWK